MTSIAAQITMTVILDRAPSTERMTTLWTRNHNHYEDDLNNNDANDNQDYDEVIIMWQVIPMK